jgi:hypothetical protein
MARNEFSKPVKVAILKRAKRPDGQMACERCGAVGLPLEIHHRKMDAMEIDKTRKLTADDGEALCAPCHSIETKAQMPVIAKAKRIEASHLGATRPTQKIKSAPFAKSEKSAKRETKESLPPRRMFVDK